VGLRAGLDRCKKISPSPGVDPQTVQPIASRYTDYATRLTTENREFNILILKFRLLPSVMIRAYYHRFGKMYCSHFQGENPPIFGLVGLHSQKNVTVSNTATRAQNFVLVLSRHIFLLPG